MKSIDLGPKFQAKVSTNGLDDRTDYSQPQPMIPIKARIESQCHQLFTQLQEHHRLNTVFQYMVHYHDVLYASGEEISKNSDQNKLIVSSLCLHMLNHVTKVCIDSDSHSRVQILKLATHRVLKRKSVF